MHADEPTYADVWHDAINETYTGAADDPAFILGLDGPRNDDEDVEVVVRQVLTKAANCLRNGVAATFTAGELDLVRHLMPAHQVHQSGSVRWVLEIYGSDDAPTEDETERGYQDDLNTAALSDLLGVPPFVAEEIGDGDAETESDEDDR